MTPKQTTFYWSLWRECCQQNGWRMERGRLLYDPCKLNEIGKKVWAVAEQLALRAHRAVVLDDLRHGCHFVALSRQRSSKDFTNPEFNKVRLVLQLCADFENLQAQMEAANPAMVESASFDSFLLKRANEAAIIAIARNAGFLNRFDSDWKSLPVEKKRWIAKNVKDRQPSRKTFYRRQLASIERKPDLELEPF